ncbi:pilus assembly protein TadG-related protein [Arthrobacter sp. NA-172]|uniref:pilus assembly protein TadG-related protein n=1 Tax=Arthrobacter sp. NA-172 TaxID=3367524 RepID=UPI0037549D1A
MSLFSAFARKRQAVGSGEHGAVAVLIALLMVVLLVFAALAIDVGSMYAEKAQLQNGADAAVLAIAQDCAKNGLVTCQANAPAKAQSLAAANVNNGQAGVQPPVFPNANSVKVTAAAGKNGSGLNMSLAPVTGNHQSVRDRDRFRGMGQPHQRECDPADCAFPV